MIICVRGPTLHTARPHRSLSQLTPPSREPAPEPVSLAHHRVYRKQVLRGTCQRGLPALLRENAGTDPNQISERHRIASDDFDDLAASTVRPAYPVHEHNQFIAHSCGLLAF